VEIQHAIDFVQQHHHAVLATYREDGGVQMSPVIVGVTETGHIAMSTRETAFKTKNLRRNQKATLCVFTNDFFGKWLQIEVTAQIISLPEAMDGLVDYYTRVVGEHPDWNDYRAAMQREQRVLVRFDVQHVGPDRQG